MCLNSANDESMKMQCSEVLEIFTPNSTVNSNSIIIAHFGNRSFSLTKIEAPMVQIKNFVHCNVSDGVLVARCRSLSFDPSGARGSISSIDAELTAA